LCTAGVAPVMPSRASSMQYLPASSRGVADDLLVFLRPESQTRLLTTKINGSAT
jgi:hypothetical protein